MNHWIDITRRIDEALVTWPGRPRPSCQWEKRLIDGDHCNASCWAMSAHSGTHADAPLHFVASGQAIDEIPLDVFIGKCFVVDLRTFGMRAWEQALANSASEAPIKRLLVRTDHSDLSGADYPPHDALMRAVTAERLIAGGLILIGVDRLSIDDSHGNDYGLHQLFLGSGCVILEGLCLSAVTPGRYELFATPLRLGGSEASPVRALLKGCSSG